MSRAGPTFAISAALDCLAWSVSHQSRKVGYFEKISAMHREEFFKGDSRRWKQLLSCLRGERCSILRLVKVVIVIAVCNISIYIAFNHIYHTRQLRQRLGRSNWRDFRTAFSADLQVRNIYLTNWTHNHSLFRSDPSARNNTTIYYCPLDSPMLQGPLITYVEPISFDEIYKDNPQLMQGGRFMPDTCVANHRVAIVIPYRNREEHLKILLRNLHPMLQRQQLDYGIYVIDQALPGKFNRAMLMNIGYVEAMKRHPYQCAIFHDVDLVPENDRNLYSCPEQPRHMSAAIDKYKYKLPYSRIFGGISAINNQQFESMNGFSNLYFGWGGEDDDMANRIQQKGYRITRYSLDLARYKMIKHSREKDNEINPERRDLLKSSKARMSWDGLNSLNYTVQAVEELMTHTRVQVLINQTQVEQIKERH